MFSEFKFEIEIIKCLRFPFLLQLIARSDVGFQIKSTEAVTESKTFGLPTNQFWAPLILKGKSETVADL